MKFKHRSVFKKNFTKTIVSLALVGFTFMANAVVDVKVLYRDSKIQNEWTKAVAEEFKAINPDINIIAAPINASESDYYAKLSLLLKSDDSIGVVREDTFTLRANVAAGFYQEIKDIDAWDEWSQFYEGVKQAGAVDGKLYGIPTTSDTRGIFYNKQMMRDLGYGDNWQPQSWDDIKATAEKVKEKYPAVLPFFFYAGMGEAATMQTFQMLMYGTNDEMFENGKWVAESPGMLASFQFIRDMTESGLGPKASLSTSQQADKTIWEKMFPDNKVAMILGGGWNTGNFKFHKNGRDAAFEDWGFAKMPKQNGDGFTSMSGGFVLSIPTNYPHTKEAMEVIKFMSNKENSVDLFSKTGEISPRKDVGEDQRYQAVDPIRVTATTFLDFTHFRPTTEQYPEISAELQRLIGAVATGSKTPEQAMKEYGEKVEKIVGSENVIRKS